ncbi:fimbrial protein [Serratia fonticola]|uniref:fimbrial protein n=1 Tax=Serratia fonticola TaxID=47917 RepID=UPI0034C5D0ED
MNINIYFGLLGTLSLLFSGTAQALIECSAYSAPSHSIPITPGTLSVGPDMPLGSIIYRGNIGPGVNEISGYTHCKNTPGPNVPGEVFSYTTSYNISNAPRPLSAWNRDRYAGKVYETGIPGVGIAMVYGNNAFTSISPYRVNTSATMYLDGRSVKIGVASVNFMLIKIGAIPAGSFNVSAAEFPTIFISRFGDASGNVVPFNFPVVYYNFSGVLRFTQPTCVTPDVDVELGRHEVASFTAAGSTTPWQNFTIQLTNCPVFSGYYNNSSFPRLFHPSGSTSTPATVSNNFELKLTPTSSIINDTNGIMAVIPAANAATGVGIQIAYDSAGSPELFRFSAGKTFKLPKNGATTLTVPMMARYIKTGSTVNPGRADGKVTFTISYY